MPSLATLTMELQSASLTNMFPRLSAATPEGLPNTAFVPWAPPAAPVEAPKSLQFTVAALSGPARYWTVPALVILRTLWHPVSARYKLFELSTAIPLWLVKDEASGLVGSTEQPFPLRTPATVPTTPAPVAAGAPLLVYLRVMKLPGSLTKRLPALSTATALGSRNPMTPVKPGMVKEPPVVKVVT